MDKALLFIVPTPIGNLRDITLRALDTLAAVDFILCEDTRHTIKLLSHYNISKPLISYQKFNESQKSQKIIKLLEEGKRLALVSDAGTPLISDPGSILINKVKEAGFRIEALPGACAFVTAWSASGFPAPVRFIGFLPRKSGEMDSILTHMASLQDTLIFYESPRRVLSTLTRIHKHFGNREVCLARELTKIYEEYIRGDLESVIQKLSEGECRGEFTIIIHGLDITEQTGIDTPTDELLDQAKKLLAQGYSRRDIVGMLQTSTSLPRKEIYRMLVNLD